MCKPLSDVTRYLICFILLFLVSACSSNVVSIDSVDSASFTTFETSVPLSQKYNHRLKLRASRVSGDYSQEVPSGKLIVIDDVQIWGPAPVAGTTDLTYGSISYGTDDIFADDSLFSEGDILEGKLGANAYLGLAQTLLDLTLVHDDTTYRISDRTTEMYLQAGLWYAITPSFHVAGSYAGSIGADLTGINEIDLKVDYALFKYLQIMVGYRWLQYDYLVEEEESSVRVRFDGPFVGLYIPF